MICGSLLIDMIYFEFFNCEMMHFNLLVIVT